MNINVSHTGVSITISFYYIIIIININSTCPKDGGGETAKRSTGMATVREKETRQTQTYLGGGD
jgi:hypothetical protein